MAQKIMLIIKFAFNESQFWYVIWKSSGNIDFGIIDKWNQAFRNCVAYSVT